jgi:hypothetical protein
LLSVLGLFILFLLNVEHLKLSKSPKVQEGFYEGSGGKNKKQKEHLELSAFFF